MVNLNIVNRKHRSMIDSYELDNYKIGNNNSLFLVAGPCVIEDIEICIDIIDCAKELCARHNINYIFKSSFDKANKTIAGSYRGPGWKNGLNQLSKIKAKRDIPILTDVHEIEQCNPTAEVASVLQIPSLLSKQIDLIIAAAKTKKTVNIKKGQFTPAWEVNNVVSRLKENDFNKIMVTERGYIFGYSTLISDMRSLQIMSQFNTPIVFDASHSVHGNDTIVSGGNLKHRDFIRPLVRSAVANGLDGLFLEVHPNPDKALSDAAGTYPLSKLEILLKEVANIEKAINS